MRALEEVVSGAVIDVFSGTLQYICTQMRPVIVMWRNGSGKRCMGGE